MKYFIITILIALCTTNLFAQKVGIVLSGGGAKGLAHIGVIKALEENNLPIDYITGTSIGSVIGGLYSIGYTTDEMIKLFHSKEFSMWLNGQTDILLKYYFMQDDLNAEWIKLRLNRDTIIKAYLPTSIVAGYQMDFAYMQIMGPGEAAANYNFDSLMIPFRCAASDVYAKKSIIFKNGNLSTAVRASMTIPVYLKPVKYDNGLLYDGGIYNNFPIKAMQEDFNPDYIIGVQVSDNNENPSEDDLITQIFNMTMDRSDFSIPEGKGIMIKPDVLSISTLDFSNIDDIIQKGYVAAKEKIPEILAAVNQRIDSTQLKAKRDAFKAKMPDFYFDNANISGLKRAHSKYVTNIFRRWSNNPRNLDFTRRFFYRLVADQTLDKLYPTSTYDSTTGYFSLNLDVTPTKNISAKIGGTISSSSTSQMFLEMERLFLGQVPIKLWYNGYFGRFYNAGKVAMRSYFTYPTIFYIEPSIFLNHWNYMEANPDILFIDTRNAMMIKQDNGLYVDLCMPIGMTNKITFGYCIGNYKQQYYLNQQFLSNDKLDKTIIDYNGFHFTYQHTTLDNPMYPTKGFECFARAKTTWLNEKFHQGTSSTQIFDNTTQNKQFYDITLCIKNYILHKGRITFPITMELNFSKHDTLCNPMANLLTLNAYRPTPYTQTIIFEDFRAQKYAAGSIGILLRLFNNLHLQLDGHIFQPYQKDFLTTDNNFNYITEQDKDFAGTEYFCNATLFYNTFIGPVAFNVRYMPQNKSHFYFMFNIGYMIFNKSWWDRN